MILRDIFDIFGSAWLSSAFSGFSPKTRLFGKKSGGTPNPQVKKVGVTPNPDKIVASAAAEFDQG